MLFPLSAFRTLGYRLLLAGVLALDATAAVAQVPVAGAACLPDLGDGKVCTANDLEVQLVTVQGPPGCTEGETVQATVAFAISRNANFLASRAAQERTRIGFFIGENGGPVLQGPSCTFSSLVPLAPPLDVSGGSGGYRDLNGDSCGDINADDLTVHHITTDRLQCRDSDGDGRLDIDIAVTWASNQNAQCTDPGDETQFFPQQSSKCLVATAVDLDVPVESPPAITLSKSASPTSLAAPGGPVTFRVSVYNASDPTDPVTLDRLVDDIHGNLDGQGSCALPATIAPGENYECAFVTAVSGSEGTTEVDTVTASGRDNEGEPVAASDTASVTLTSSSPPARSALALSKVASPRQLAEPGGTVSYAIILENTGNVSLDVSALLDDRYPGGSLDGAGSCSVPFALPAGASYRCNFALPVNGTPGDTIVNTATARASADGTAISAQASATVTIVDLPARLALRKEPSPAFLPEPGGEVSYTLQLVNLSVADSVTVDTLVDSPYGDVADGTNENINSTDCVVPQTLPPGGVYECTFAAEVSGAAGDEVPDTVTATGEDDDGRPVTVSAGAVVGIEDAQVTPPVTLTVFKTASPTSLPEPGGPVTFSVTVTNGSSADAVELTGLVDDVHGDLAGRGSCALPQPLAAGDSYRCSFSADVIGPGGAEERDTVTATAVASGDGDAVTAQASAVVTLLRDPPALAVSKRADRFFAAPGEEVTFSVTVTNGSASRALELRALVDDIYGDLNGQGDCALPQQLPAGSAYRCDFPGVMGSGIVGMAGLGLHRNSVAAQAIAGGVLSRDLLPLRDSASAFVIIAGFASSGAAAVPTLPLTALLLLALLLGLLVSRRRR